MIWLTILSILRSLFAAIDRIIAWAIEEVYVLIVELANVRIFSGQVIEAFANRINILLGLIMLFWLAFRIIKYVVNPDLVSDAQQGAGKIITNVVVMLFMLLFVNFGFKAMYEFQNVIFSSDVLPNVIFGTTNKDFNGDNVDSSRKTGKKIAFYIYSGFIYPQYGDNSPFQNACKNFVTLSGTELDDCLENVAGYSSDAIARGLSVALDETSVEELASGKLVTARSGEEFVMNYTFIISSVCGVAALLVLVQIAIDVAIRVAKLGLLQLIAPVPIISYVDPMSGKNGIFSQWLKEVGKTFASVFVRLAALYFSVFTIMMIISNKAYMGADVAGIKAGDKISLGDYPLLTIMLILGALLFAKELPKLISQIFGIKTDGGFTLNPMKRIGSAPGMGIAKNVAKRGLNAGGALVGGAVGGMAANAWAAKRKNSGILKGIGSTVAGGFSAGTRALGNGLRGQGLGAAISSGVHASTTARNTRATYAKAEMDETGKKYGAINRFADAVDEMAGVQNDAGGYGAMDMHIHDTEKKISDLRASAEAKDDYASAIAAQNTSHTLSEYDSYAQAYQKYTASLSSDEKQMSVSEWMSKDPANRGGNDNAVRSYVDAKYSASKDRAEAKKKANQLDIDKQAYASRTSDKNHGHGGK